VRKFVPKLDLPFIQVNTDNCYNTEKVSKYSKDMFCVLDKCVKGTEAPSLPIPLIFLLL